MLSLCVYYDLYGVYLIASEARQHQARRHGGAETGNDPEEHNRH